MPEPHGDTVVEYQKARFTSRIDISRYESSQGREGESHESPPDRDLSFRTYASGNR